MPFTVNSYAARSATSGLAPYKLERRDIATNDVLIDILYTGICHSDIHRANGDWGSGAPYPIVVGHEIVGRVSKVGPDVENTRVGDIVAIGCLVDSCEKCGSCLRDQEQFCSVARTGTYAAPELRWPGHFTAGGYSEAIVVQEHFVLKVPETLHEPRLLRGVAPILCAGITMYSPLRRFHVGKGTKVAIVGLGGLGHMGVKLAHALGAEVTVISRSHKKDDQAKQLGADKIVASSSADEMNGAVGYFDLVLDTIPFEHDVNPYMALVQSYGAVCMVGHIGKLEKEPINTRGLIWGNKILAGSLIGGIKETQELLDLCGEKGIISEYELIEMEAVNDAWAKITAGDGAERYIIDIGAYRAANEAAA